MRRAALLLLLQTLLLAGCGTDLAAGSPAERCGELMQQAFPGGRIEVTRTQLVPAPAESIATMVITAEGRRRGIAPGGPPLSDVAVECRYNDGILTGFRWTRGPLR